MIRRGLAVAAAISLGGCRGYQSALAGDGAESANFLSLFWVFLAVCAVMYAIVVVALGIAVWRRRGGEAITADTGDQPRDAPILRPLLIGWTALILVGLVGLTIASFFTDRSNAAAAAKPGLIVSVTANQWWWNVDYVTQGATRSVQTANEIHLPVGVPAEVTLQSNDVIHSLWIPSLAGKQDLIPGRVTDLQLLPLKAGYYRAQCAEYCGTQHAHMALDVTVESKADFQRWLDAQKEPAVAPRTPLELAGYTYVTTRQCSACHTIGGTPAGGTVGPDLTHFASRKSIAAGTLPMNRGNLYRWVADPQAEKPGNHMPTIGMSPQDVDAVAAYLETLK